MSVNGEARPRNDSYSIIITISVIVGIAGVALIVFAGYRMWSTSHTSHYPVNVEANFLNSCESSGSGSRYCQCVYNRIEAKYSLDEYQMLESDMRATGTLPVELGAQVIDKCGGDFKASEEISAPTTLDFAERQKIVQNTMGNFAITASNPRFAADLSGAENVCFDLQAKNNGTSDASPTGIYRLAIPSGVVTFENNLVSIDQLVFPQVIPGAVSSGTKCFPTQGERGNFTIKISLVSLMEVEIPIDVS